MSVPDWPIYVINLDRAVERWAAVTARLNRAGLAFQRFPAVDARTLTAEQIRDVVAADQVRRFKHPLSRPEIACYLSHIAAWRVIATGDKPAAFVFEDDVDMNEDGPDLLKAVSARRPDWDVLRFYAEREFDLLDSAPITAGYRYGVPDRQPFYAIAYAMTRNAAAHLARMAVPFAMPVDMDFRHWWRFNACMKLVVPSPLRPARDHLSTSEIVAGRLEHKTDHTWRRFVRNSRYQLGYRLGCVVHRRGIQRSPVWPQLPESR